jgi:hypothetical protein
MSFGETHTIGCAALVAIAFGACFAPASAEAATYTTCIRWQAQTLDSGFGEDRISFANAPSVITAYGVRIEVSKGGWSDTLDTSPTSGCVTWSSGALTPPFSVRVYAYVEDSNDNAIRYHDAGDDAFGTYPGATYSALVTNYVPSTTAATYVDVGSGNPIYTAMATASMVSRYYPGFTTTGTQIHMADSISCGGSSSLHCGTGPSCLYANGDTYVRLSLPTCAGSSDHRRRKFITAHELGHARADLVQEQQEANVDDDLASGTCNDGSGYSMTSREWDSVGLREGHAHFVAAWTFNSSSETDGFMRWFDTTFNIESNTPELAGGFIENNCGGMTNGQTTNLDVVRLFWDWGTPVGGPGRATRSEIAEIYSDMVVEEPASNGYWDTYYDLAGDIVAADVHDALQTFGCYNGVADGC